MLITMSADGSLITSVPEIVNQGSNNANQIILVSPIAESNSVTITFKLPNGNYTEPVLMTPADNIDTQLGFNAWTYLLNYNITQYSGIVEYQIKATNVEGDAITSSAGSFNVVAGVPPVLPSTPTQDIYNQILQSLSNISQQYINVTDNLSVGAYPANSIVEYNNTILYPADTLVHQNGILYISKQETKGHSPETDTTNTYWNMFLNIKTFNLGSTFSQATPVISDNGVTFYLTTNVNGLNLSTNSLLGLPIISGNNIEFNIDSLNRLVISTPSIKAIAGNGINFEDNIISVDTDIIADKTFVSQNYVNNQDFSETLQNYVDISSNQNIVGNKTFTRLVSTNYIQNSNGGFNAGQGASADTGGAIGISSYTMSGGSIGDSSYSDWGGAVGNGAITGNGFSGGYNAKTIDSNLQYIDAIQLGTGTNTKANTLQVYSYTLMNSNGTIPSERLNLIADTGINITGTTISADTSYLATQSFVTSAISNISQFSIVKVDTLPSQGESNKLYLVPSSSATTDNVFDEYIWVEINTGSFDWEQIGTTAIDLSNCVTTDTTQTITGAKTFTNSITIGNSINSTLTPNSLTLNSNKTFNVNTTTNSLQYQNTTNNITYDLDNVQLEISGNNLVLDLTGDDTLNVGKVYLCTSNDASNTYLAGHLYLIGGSSGSYTATDITPISSITVDSELSTTSTNPVQNSVITNALNDKQDILTAGTGISIENNVISSIGGGGVQTIQVNNTSDLYTNIQTLFSNNKNILYIDYTPIGSTGEYNGYSLITFGSSGVEYSLIETTTFLFSSNNTYRFYLKKFSTSAYSLFTKSSYIQSSIDGYNWGDVQIDLISSTSKYCMAQSFLYSVDSTDNRPKICCPSDTYANFSGSGNWVIYYI